MAILNLENVIVCSISKLCFLFMEAGIHQAILNFPMMMSLLFPAYA